MAIDYSKWDKIELSDDSDIEVHPNVDKASFIRWKQEDIHQKREQRNHDIKALETQKSMYLELNKRVDQLLSEVDTSKLADFDFIKTYLAEHFDPISKPENVEEDAPTHNEMIEDLFIQLKKDVEKEDKDPDDGANIKDLVLIHRKKINDVLEKNLERLESLYKEREMHISSSDIHTGWDRSFLNKGDTTKSGSTDSTTSSSAPIQTPSYTSPTETETTEPATSTTKSSETVTNPTTKASTSIETPGQLTQVGASKSEDNEQIDELHPDTETYSQFSIEKIEDIRKFLKAHTHIISQEQKDSLMMKAFDVQLAGDDKNTYRYIYLATLLQYILDIVQFKRTNNPNEISIIIDQLLSKMFANTSNPAYDAFKSENERTFNHIKARCEILSTEQTADEDIQEIQLKSLDEGSELVVNLPNPESNDPDEVDRYEVFKKLPKSMRDALQTESLDEVNKVFHGMPIAEAEEILEIFEECGVIGVQALIENEEEWNEIKQEHKRSINGQKVEEILEEDEPEEPQSTIQNLEINDDYRDTADIVD